MAWESVKFSGMEDGAAHVAEKYSMMYLIILHLLHYQSTKMEPRKHEIYLVIQNHFKFDF